jgi:hypothetical protein
VVAFIDLYTRIRKIEKARLTNYLDSVAKEFAKKRKGKEMAKAIKASKGKRVGEDEDQEEEK